MNLDQLLADKVKSESDESPLKTSLMPSLHPSSLPPIGPSVYESLLSLYLNPTLLAQLGSSPLLPNPNLLSTLFPLLTPGIDENKESAKAEQLRSSPNSKVDKIVPNTDKEGWCRNKKYIAKIPTGFMCTVCRKVYGRYNSVSYHVTIYHRNPPIKCGMAGCDFTTREARYIHFHKYYRHGVELPESIDLGSRRCPYCRHVSKSPAMLEKHMARHDTKNEGKKTPVMVSETLRIMDNTPLSMITKDVKEEAIETESVSEEKTIEEDEATETSIDDENESVTKGEEDDYECTQCEYRTTNSSLLSQHLLFSHSEMFPSQVRCLLCPFSAPSQSALLSHTLSAHLPAS